MNNWLIAIVVGIAAVIGALAPALLMSGAPTIADTTNTP